MKSLSITLLVFLSATCVADVIVPVYEEPFHRPVTDTRTYRVLDVLIPPGKTTLFHTHAEPTLYVTLRRTTVRAQRIDEDWGEIGTANWQPGYVIYDGAAVDTPFTHRVENLGDENFRLTLIASNRRTPKANTDLFQSLPGEPGLDSEFFAQSRIDLEPGQVYDFGGIDHELIFVSASESDVTINRKGIGGDPLSVNHLGDVETLQAGRGLLFENRGDNPAIIIAVAVR